jgi:hypothetical protein
VNVSQLISKLQTCNPDAIILTDQTELQSLDTSMMSETMSQATLVAQGVAYKLFIQNNDTNCYATQENWRYQPSGVPLAGQPAVYIGSGVSIITPMWDKK